MEGSDFVAPAGGAAPEPRAGGGRVRKGLYLLPSLFTAANIGMGYFAVMGAVRGFQLLDAGGESDLARAAAHFDNSARAIGWAILFDALDGRVARLTRTTTEIGIQLDSLADVLTFGITPAILVYAWGYGAAFPDGSPAHKLGWFVSFMFLICGVYRLARFNVQATRPRPLAEGTAKVDKKNFVGLPIPAAAGLIAALIHFSPDPLVAHGDEAGGLYAALLMALVALLGALMVSSIRYSSFKSAGAAGRRGAARMIILLAAVGMLVWLFSRYFLLAFITAYVLHGILFRLTALARGRQPQPQT
ncbi:MAG TPA: CDP-alcohol phosphatidyltransferase family protein [Pyrinomonadaceae bacterium]|nr:CDP-alcohol phosphatidyltransferase family protein [Pyrinomonadaceae bacterium]